jgi:hypothetical protein
MMRQLSTRTISITLLAACSVACHVTVGSEPPASSPASNSPQPASAPPAAPPPAAHSSPAPPPPPAPPLPQADLTTPHVVTHLSITNAALKAALDQDVPHSGAGSFSVLVAQAHYKWTRTGLDTSVGQGKINVDAHINVDLDAPNPVGKTTFPIEVRTSAVPVLGSDYVVRLQDLDVKVSSTDSRVNIANAIGDVYNDISRQIETKIKGFTYDVKPMLTEAKARIEKPINLPVGDAHGCASLRVLGVQANPTIFEGGIQKDIAIMVAPSVAFPCGPAAATQPLPPLADVQGLPPGSFTLPIPIVVDYSEITKALASALKAGKYYFSKQYPKLYVSDPSVSASGDTLLVKFRVQGTAPGVSSTPLNETITLSGRPSVTNNLLTVPDLDLGAEAKSLLAKLKLPAADANAIRDLARGAANIDISQRLQPLQGGLSTELNFGSSKDKGCLRAGVDKVAVTTASVQPTYLSVAVSVTAHTSLEMPCP